MMMKQIILLALPLVIVLTNQGMTQSVYCSKYKGSLEGKRLQIEDFRSDSVDIIHTVVDLDFTSMNTGYIEGETSLSFKVLVAGVMSTTFDLEGLTVDSISGLEGATFDQNSTSIDVAFSQALALNQTYELTIHYHGDPIKDGSGWGGFYFQNGFAWNLGVGFASDPHSYGRIWFPCFDNFIERSSMEYFIKTPSDKLASCNGELIDSVSNMDGSKTYHWKLDQPIPSYLACVAIANYQVVQSIHSGIEGSFPVQLFARAGDTSNLKASFVNLDNAISAFEASYGDYKFDKVGYSLVPFNSGAMEHATNITYPIYAADGSLSQQSLMAHELAHMWWGDNVTCQTDGDMWINEGWASFSEYVFEEHVNGREAYENAMLRDLRFMLQYGHHNEEEYRPVSGQPHEYVYGDHVYKKGALVAHNLRGHLGDDDFFDAAEAFMDAYQFQPVSSDSLEKFFSGHAGEDLSYFFRDWVFNPGYNVVVLDSFTTNPNGNGFNVSLFLQQKIKGAPQFHDDTRVYVTLFDENWNTTERIVEMSGQNALVNVDVPFDPIWVVLNEGNEMAWASTADQVRINSPEFLSLQNAYWTVNVESVDDSALVRFEQVWAAPDPVKAWSEKPYVLNNYRYWRVSGINIENVTMSGSFFYDGRNFGSGSSGYLDIDLLLNGEDSLVLLYRPSSHYDWEEFNHYTKNLLGSNDNALGLIELSQILEGEYVLANIDHSILSNQNLKASNMLKVYPNPSNGKLHVEASEDLKGGKFYIYSLEGRLLQETGISNKSEEVDISGLSSGVYIYKLKDDKGRSLNDGRFVLEK